MRRWWMRWYDSRGFALYTYLRLTAKRGGGGSTAPSLRSPVRAQPMRGNGSSRGFGGGGEQQRRAISAACVTRGQPPAACSLSTQLTVALFRKTITLFSANLATRAGLRYAACACWLEETRANISVRRLHMAAAHGLNTMYDERERERISQVNAQFFMVAIFQGYGIRLSGVRDFCIFLPF